MGFVAKRCGVREIAESGSSNPLKRSCMAHKPMSGRVASFLIKIAEDPRVKKAFTEDPQSVAKREGLTTEDVQVLLAIGQRDIALSMSADAGEFDQNQQMFIFKKI